MRYTRAGKSTHQRVPDEATPWNDLKNTPAKATNKGIGRSIQKSGGKPGFGGPRNSQSQFNNRRQGNGRPHHRREDEESANFVSLGSRPGGPSKFGKNVIGSGESKQVKIQGQYWVPAADAIRLEKLTKQLKEQGLKKKEIFEALKNERRKAEKLARRARDKTCFNCRQFGHILENCPTVNKEGGEGDAAEGSNNEYMAVGICFKCGSTEHSSRDCKKKADKFDFAKCFVCSKTGHISRQCPENKKGKFPSGGACNICDDVGHLARDCPKAKHNQIEEDDTPMLERMSDPFVSPDFESVPANESKASAVKPKNRKVKF